MLIARRGGLFDFPSGKTTIAAPPERTSGPSRSERAIENIILPSTGIQGSAFP
jgi:hypothetical protein